MAPIDIDVCLMAKEKERLHEVDLSVPLTNILYPVEDFNVANVKIY